MPILTDRQLKTYKLNKNYKSCFDKIVILLQALYSFLKFSESCSLSLKMDEQFPRKKISIKKTQLWLFRKKRSAFHKAYRPISGSVLIIKYYKN